MKKTICKTVYDTENSTLIKKITFGHFGASDGYEESLYQTPNGLYFIYVNGGVDSKHPKEDISRISAERKTAWLTANA